MKTFSDIIKDNVFNVSDEYVVDTKVDKMCWGCETKHKSGHMVWDSTKFRRIFFCEECFKKLKD
jgi:hypothetical protein